MKTVNKEKPKRRRTQTERRAESDKKLLKSAVELIGQKGFSNTSLEEIGLNAGYSRGLVSHRYGSKEGLAKAMILEMSTAFKENINKPLRAEHKGVDAVIEIVSGYFMSLQNAPAQSRALHFLELASMGSLPNLQDDIAEMSENFNQLLLALLKEAKAYKQIAEDLDIEAVAFNINANLRGITLMWVTSSSQVNLNDVLQEVVTTIKKRLAV